MKNTKRKPVKMWITGIDENNAAITNMAVKKPICDSCLRLAKEGADLSD